MGTTTQMHTWLIRQLEESRALAEQSDMIRLAALSTDDDSPPERFMVEFLCRTLVRDPDTLGISECTRTGIGFRFHPEYLDIARPLDTVTLLGPPHVFHPNVGFPFVCVGRMPPGTPLVDLIYQCHEMLSFQRVTPEDPLNKIAAEWWRRNQDRFPLDTRPLKSRTPPPEAAQ